MKKLIYLLTLIVAFNSCITVNHNRFTYYKKTPDLQPSFNTNGVYYRFKEFHGDNGDYRYWASLYFFYKDGNALATALPMKDSLDKDILLKLSKEFNSAVENSKGSGGTYAIAADTLKAQMFTNTQHRTWFGTDIVEYHFAINKDGNSITLLSRSCEWCSKQEKKDLAKPGTPEEYKFLPTATKPDSSKIWYKKKKWYKR